MTKAEQDKLIGTQMESWRGGVEYRGSVEKVFFHPTYETWIAKCVFFNEPGSYFYREVN